MDAVQFGRWISDRRSKYGFRSQRALAERSSYDPTLGQLDITENFLARLEAGRLAYPFRGSVRGRVTALAWLLCSTSRDVRTYYQAAGLTELDNHETEQLRVLRNHLAMRHAQRVLPLPLRPQKLIGREPILRELIETLCTMDSGHYAITGLPGVGKSALASEALHRLAADERTCLQVFPDGVAALTCAGRQGRSGLFSLLADVIAIFDPPASSYLASNPKGSSKSHAASTEEAGLATMLDRARLVLAGKQTLLLLDNVEAQLPLRQVVETLLAPNQQTLLLQKGGETRHARRVILTTGCYIPPPALVAHHLHLEPLDSDAALQFFTMLVSRSLSPDEVQAVRQVCAAVGCLPLAIQVAATAVAVEGIPLPFLAAYVADHPLDDVLDSAYELRSRLAQAMSDFDVDAQKSFALLSTLGVASFELESAVALRSKSANVRSETRDDTPGDQQARSVSGVVPGNQSHDESAAVDGFDLPLERIAGTVADLGRFVRHSLIDLTSPGEPVSPHSPEGTFTDRRTRYRLHPLLFAHARNTLNQVEQQEVQAARRNIQAYALAYIERFQGDTTRLAQEYALLVASLRSAVQDAQYGHVVHLIEGLAPIVAHMSSYDEGKRLFLWGIQASRYLSDHFHHVSFLNDLGLLSRRHEDFALATRAWTESLEIAASSLSHRQEDIWCPLSELAHIAHIHGEVDASLRYAETYMKHCLEGSDPIDIARARYIYAFYARLQGDHERAYKHMSSARDIFSQYHPVQMSPAEQLLGLRIEAELARAESNYPASQAPVEQAASLIQMIGNQYLLADTLFDQACFAQQQRMYDDARRLAQRTMQIAESGKLSHFYRRSTLLLRQLAGATYD